jgi:general stress protein 26
MGTLKKDQAGGVAAQTRDKFRDLVRSFDTAMLVTQTPDGASHARPMGIAEISEDGDLWFVSRDDSAKTAEIRGDQRTLVTMQSSAKQLAIYGRARLVRDPQKIEALWREPWRVYFDDKHDPRLVLIHVDAEEAEYWDNSGTAGLKYYLKAAAAYVTGKEMADPNDPSIHARVKA